MRFCVRPAKFIHERAFTEALADTCRALGHRQLKQEARSDFVIQWGAELRLPGTLYCELAWLPRWSYQVSWTGINFEHQEAGHQAPHATSRATVLEHLRAVRRGDGMPKRGWGYCDPTVEPSTAFRVPYMLAPLQVPTDANMRSLPPELRTPQAFINYVVSLDLGRVYFKQHPASTERDRPLRVPPPHKIILHRQGQIAAYLKTVECRGVIVANSNVAHDAMLWGKVAQCLGNGFWGNGPTVFIPYRNKALGYLEHLMAHQWTLDTITPERVQKLLEARP